MKSDTDDRPIGDRESPDAPPPFRLGSIGRHSAIYGVGMLLSKAVAIVMLPIYTRWLTPADYGVLQLITMTFEVLTIVAGSRIAVGIFHFYHKEADEEGRRRVISTAFLLLATTYTIAAIGTVYAAPAIAGLVFGEGELFVTLIRLAAISMAFEGLILVPVALFQLQDRSKLFVLVSLVRLALQVVLNLIFLIPLTMGVSGVMWGSVITHAVIGVSLAVGLLGSVGWSFRLTIARSFLRFGIPLIAMQVATFIVTFGDRYFLNIAAGTAEVGLYGLAYQFGFLVVTLGFVPFNQVWDPQRFAVAKRPDRDAIYAQVFFYVNLVLMSVALGISLFAGDALRLIAAPEFHPAAVFVPLLSLAYVFQSWSFFLNLGIYFTERTEYFTLANWISAIVAIAGYLWLIPLWYAWGAVITTLVSLTVRCWLAHVFSQRLWRVEYRWDRIVRLGGLAIVGGTVSALTPTMFLPISIVFHTALFGVYATLVWLRILKSGERALIENLLARRRPSLGTV